MKNLFIISLIAIMTVFAPSSFAQESSKETVRETKENTSKPKKNRRKKVMMCHECGKPEIECECEGEEHGVKNDQAHKDDEHDH